MKKHGFSYDQYTTEELCAALDEVGASLQRRIDDAEKAHPSSIARLALRRDLQNAANNSHMEGMAEFIAPFLRSLE
jgi:hypothetical protein